MSEAYHWQQQQQQQGYETYPYVQSADATPMPHTAAGGAASAPLLNDSMRSWNPFGPHVPDYKTTSTAAGTSSSSSSHTDHAADGRPLAYDTRPPAGAGTVGADYGAPVYGGHGAHASSVAPSPSSRLPTTGPLPPPPINAAELGILSNFVRTFGSMLDALCATWPECPLLVAKKHDFDTLVVPYKAIQERFCKEYHKQMKDYYDACTARNLQPFLDGKIKFLDEIAFKQKYDDMHNRANYPPDMPQAEIDTIINDNIDHVLEYIMEINKHARLFNDIPPSVINKIESKTLELAQDIHAGRIDFSSLDLGAIGQSVLNNASSHEVGELIKNMSSIYEAVGGIDGAQHTMDMGLGGAGGPKIEIRSLPNSIGPIMAMLAKQQESDQRRQTQAQQPRSLQRGWTPPTI